MSEPEDPRWLDEIAAELRHEVPVRPAWRARLLDEVARAPKPSVRADVDVRTRFRASYVRVVVAPFASDVTRRLPAASYEYVVVPVTGLIWLINLPKSSYVYVVTFPFGAVTLLRLS